MGSQLSKKLNDFQDTDSSEPALFRYLISKDYRDHKEDTYIERYRTAFYLEVFIMANIPIFTFLLARSRPQLNASYLSRKRHSFACAVVFTAQFNAFLGSQYFRKVKRYDFEEKLFIKYHKELTVQNNKIK